MPLHSIFAHCRAPFPIAPAILSAVALGCAPSDPQSREPLELRPFVYLDASLPVSPLTPGDAVELWHAPQGGFVLPVGARIRGLDSETIQIRARLLDPASREVIAEHVRMALVTPVAGEPGWVENDRRSITQFAHIPACPPSSAQNLLDGPLTLEVFIVELHADDSEGQATLPVVLSCPSADPALHRACVCDCSGPEGSECEPSEF